MLSVDLHWRAPGGRFDLSARFEAGPGVTILFGPSGAGKTVTLRAIAGLEKPEKGRIALGPRVLYDSAAGVDAPVETRGFGMVFQEPRLFPHMTVRRNLLYGAPSPTQAPLAEVADLLGVADLLDRRPRRLSGGEAQRVALARALLREPEMLLMDEPMANLDQARRNEVAPYLARLAAEAGRPILYVTHSIEEARLLGDRVVRMRAGEIAEAGGMELLSAPLDG